MYAKELAWNLEVHTHISTCSVNNRSLFCCYMLTETQLKVADLGRLNLLLQNVSAYWIPIADQLEMTSQVDIIRNTTSNTVPSQFLRDLLHRWLNREHPLPTLETLCQALRGDVAITGGGNVAKELEKEFQAQKGLQ